MSLTVVTTPLDPLCNSYVSLAEMLAYVTDRVSDSAVLTAWTALTTDQKSTYVVNASRSIDTFTIWIGDKYSRDQRLDWPRVNAYIDGFILDQITFPDRVKEATCEMAIFSMQNNGLISVAQNAALDSVKVGPITVDFNEDVGGSAEKYFPDIVAYLLSDYGTVNNPDLPNSRSIRVARLLRA